MEKVSDFLQELKMEMNQLQVVWLFMSDHMLILLCILTGTHRAYLVPACCLVGEAGAHKGSNTHVRPWE